MREIALYRWIFGLALLLAGIQLWLFKAPGDGFLGLALAFVVFFVFALLVVSLIRIVAIWAFDFALTSWDFLLRLLGLRESD